ncbi:MAG: hypothetical protein IT364_16145 [Candidatus Hydrogenedentes bacterium]|nr:hypothetical protein [Candidatus Hydrogenedentota bacterium]
MKEDTDNLRLLSGLRLYTIYVLIAAICITVAKEYAGFFILLSEEAHLLLGLPLFSVFMTAPYIFLLLMAVRRRISLWARIVYAVAATLVPIPGILDVFGSLLMDEYLNAEFRILTWQYAAALGIVTIGAVIEVLESIFAKKKIVR